MPRHGLMPLTVLCPQIAALHGHIPKTSHITHGALGMKQVTPCCACVGTWDRSLACSHFQLCVCPAVQALLASDAGVVESVSICRAGEFSCPLRCGVLFMANCNHLQWAMEEDSCIMQACQVCQGLHSIHSYTGTVASCGYVLLNVPDVHLYTILWTLSCMFQHSMHFLLALQLIVVQHAWG